MHSHTHAHMHTCMHSQPPPGVYPRGVHALGAANAAMGSLPGGQKAHKAVEQLLGELGWQGAVTGPKVRGWHARRTRGGGDGAMDVLRTCHTLAQRARVVHTPAPLALHHQRAPH